MIYPRERPTNIGGKKLQHHLFFDNMNDFANLPTLDKVAPGSDAYCLDTSDAYVLSAATGKWSESAILSGVGAGGSGGSSDALPVIKF